ncbi:MAG: hypothetical protein HGB11_06385 [Chlorobiales bacterium]|nr:hypothetical protein [Chlorobiales bacterium]
MYYLVKYSGPFGFIKPWTAVRDGETFTQQFLTPSIVEGIEKKLFPELLQAKGSCKIVRHRLTYFGLSNQQEQTQTRGWNVTGKLHERPRSILIRGVMINPSLWLAFGDKADATKAISQHICLCRNEDVMLPDEEIVEVSEKEFDENSDLFNGFELIFEKNNDAFLVGYNRYDRSPMYGWLKIVGNPVK